MQKWEYATIIIGYDKKHHKDWVVEYADQSPLVGLSSILRTYGEAGWELVSLNTDGMHASPGFGTWFIDPASYRATFKRPSS